MGFHNFFGEKIIFGGPVADPVKIRDPGFLLDSLDFHWIFTGGATRGVINSACPNIFLEVRKDSTKIIKEQKQKLQACGIHEIICMFKRYPNQSGDATKAFIFLLDP